MSLEEQLHQKNEAYHALQQQYDEFVDSSKEIETELENEVKSLNDKYNDLLRKWTQSEDKIKQLNDKSQQLVTENVKLSSEVSKLRDNVGKLEEMKKDLETKNNDYEEKNRILEATEEDMKHRILTLEEEVYFAQNDVVELTNAKESAEARLKAELTELQAEVALSSAPIDDEELLRLREELEILTKKVAEVDELKESLAESEASLSELSEELERTQEEVLRKASFIDELKAQLHITPPSNVDDQRIIAELREEVRVKEAELEATRASLAEQQSRHEEELATNGTHDRTQLLSEIDHLNRKLNELAVSFAVESPPTASARRPTTPPRATPTKEPITSSPETFFMVSKKNKSSGKKPTKKLSPAQAQERAVDELIDAHGLEDLLVESSLAHRLAAREAILSNDSEKLKTELIRNMKHLEETKKNNARLLQSLLALKGTIQVCCRTRPSLGQLDAGQGKIVVDVVDDTEITCYDRRSEQWRSFVLDKVWSPSASQVCFWPHLSYSCQHENHEDDLDCDRWMSLIYHARVSGLGQQTTNCGSPPHKRPRPGTTCTIITDPHLTYVRRRRCLLTLSRWC